MSHTSSNEPEDAEKRGFAPVNDGLTARLEAINSTIGRKSDEDSASDLRQLLDRLSGRSPVGDGEQRPSSLAEALDGAGLTRHAPHVDDPSSDKVMGGDTARNKRPVGAGSRVAMTLRLDHDRYDELKRAAKADGITIQTFLQRALDTTLSGRK